MKFGFITFVLAAPALLLAAGCGGKEPEAPGDQAGGQGSSSVHECDVAKAKDQTSQTAVTINTTGLTYDPACVRVKAGTAVTFKSNFATHPLVGGEFRDGKENPDAASPIKPTSTGMEATFTLDKAGDYPYYCDVHAAAKMYGVIFVE